MEFHREPLGCRAVTDRNLGECYLQFADSKSSFQFMLNNPAFGIGISDMLSLLHSEIQISKYHDMVPLEYDGYAHMALELLNMIEPGTYTMFELAVLYVFHLQRKSVPDMCLMDSELCVSLFIPGEGYGVFELPKRLRHVPAVVLNRTFFQKIVNPKVVFYKDVKSGRYDHVGDEEYNKVKDTIDRKGAYFDGPDSSLFSIAVNVLKDLYHTIDAYKTADLDELGLACFPQLKPTGTVTSEDLENLDVK